MTRVISEEQEKQKISFNENNNNAGKYFNWENNTVLLFDDDEMNRKILSIYFRKTYCRLIVETDRTMVLEAARDYNPDAILIGLSFSYQDNIELIRKVRQTNDQILIIVQTFMVLEKIKKACFNAGCNYFFLKPLDFVKLMSVMDTCLSPHR